MRTIIAAVVLAAMTACGGPMEIGPDGGCGQPRVWCAGDGRMWGCFGNGTVAIFEDCTSRNQRCSYDGDCPGYVDGGPAVACCD